MANLLRLSACLFVLLSFNANSATVTTQVQKISYVCNSYNSPVWEDPCSSTINTIDYSDDDVFYTFTATWDNISSTLNISVSDGNYGQFTDGYYHSTYDSEGYMDSTYETLVSINETGGGILSFQATLNNHDYYMSYYSISWIYDGDHLIRQTQYDDYMGMFNSEDTLIYGVISPSPVPLPAGITLFLSGLGGLGFMRGWNG